MYDFSTLFSYYHSLNQPLGEVSQTLRGERQTISFEALAVPFLSLSFDNQCWPVTSAGSCTKANLKITREIPKPYAKLDLQFSTQEMLLS
jgi:hypothetical protein